MKNTLLFTYSTSILVSLPLTVNMKKFLTPKIRKMCHPILLTLLKMQPHYSQSSREKRNLAQRKTNSSFECTFAFVLRCVRNQHSLLQMRLSLKKQNQYFYLIVTQFNNPILINKIISQIMTGKRRKKKL